MSRRLVRPLVAAAVVAGVLAGIVVALVVPTRSEGTAQPPRITVLPRKPHKLDVNEVRIAPVKGTVRIELTTPDPLGGPPFAVRVFRDVRRLPPPVHGPRRPGRVLGHDLCAQLGRVYQGRFGWIDSRHRFRPVGFNYDEAPLQCGDRWRDAKSEPVMTRTTLITDPLQTEAQETETVIWGIGGSLLRGVALQGPRIHDLHPKPSARGAFLALADPTGPSRVSAHFAYAQRPPKTLVLDPARFGPVPPPLNRFEHGMILGTDRLEARAPDPTGGLGWGIEASRTTKGGYCPWEVGRVVGSHVGNVNYALGTIDDPHAQPCLQKVQFPAKMPLSINELYGASPDEESGSDPDVGRVALRTLPGRSVISGLARPDVREFTIETPRDVRTIVPSARAHAFIVVYDGSFPAGDTVITVTFNDGAQRVQRMPNYPF